MKKKKIIKKLEKRIGALEKQLTKSSLTLIDPDNENKSVVIQIKEGRFTEDSYLKSFPVDTNNIISQPI